MPIYTIKNNRTGKEWDVTCSYEELQKTLETPNLVRSFVPLKIISTHGSLLSKTSQGWKDRLGQIKKGSGKGKTNKI